MLGKSKKNENSSVSASLGRKTAPSVISSDMNVLGNILSEGFIDIDGHIEGNVKCDNTTIRTNGLVKGDVVAQHVQVYGRVEGLIKAKVVTLFSSAYVSGVIMHESLSIEDGAFVDGKFKRTDKIFIDDEGETGSDNAGSGDDDDEDEQEDVDVMENLRLISG